jgi:hypothetical protein
MNKCPSLGARVPVSGRHCRGTVHRYREVRHLCSTWNIPKCDASTIL